MKTVNVSELKARLSHYLQAVRHGEVLLVRDRDRVIARLEVAGPGEGKSDEKLARLESEGVLRRRRRKMDVALVASRIKSRAQADVVAALLAERAEGR
jgi:antitoxin (DNA-binding transcriptional repressor) of toxin-antitoxin stability system